MRESPFSTERSDSLLFVAIILIGLAKVLRVSREAARRDPDYSLLGASLAACLLGTLFVIASTSMIYGHAILFYTLAGLAAAYAYVGRLPEPR